MDKTEENPNGTGIYNDPEVQYMYQLIFKYEQENLPIPGLPPKK